MDLTAHETVWARTLVPPTRITTNTTVVGSTHRTNGMRDATLLVSVGAYTVGDPAVALTLRIFSGHETDMGDETQLGDDYVFTALAANTTSFVRVNLESGASNFRAKVVSAGGTSHDVVVGVTALSTTPPLKPPPGQTLAATLTD